MQIKTMRAAILTELNHPLVVDEVTLPERLEAGQVLVKVLESGICGSQLGEIDGIKGEDRYLPHLLGHEGSGIVLDVGSGVTTVKAGDRVVMHWRKGTGIDARPPVYKWQGKPLNAGFVTTFNEYAVVSENRVTRVPDDLNPGVGALMGCAVTTGFGVMMNNAGLKIGESVVILGVGGVGLCMVQASAMTSAHPIVAVDLWDNRLKLAERLGATHLINAAHGDPYEQIQAVFENSGSDVVVDNTGDPDVVAMAYRLTNSTGRTILVGVPRAGTHISLHSLPLHFGKILSGSHGGETCPETDIPRYLRLYQCGKLNLDALITDRLTLDRINIALDMMRNGEAAGRCLIRLTD